MRQFFCRFARSLDSLIRYGVDGVIVGGGKFLTNDVVERINHYQIPMVCAARASEFSGIDVVRPTMPLPPEWQRNT